MKKISLITKNLLPPELLDILRLADKIAENKRFKVYCVGGFVRDILLKADNFDIDLTVEGDCLKFAELFAGALNGKLVFYKRFNTATVKLKGSRKADIAMARKEHYEHPAALPKVRPGSIRDDLARRDFTINAMAIPINKNKHGALIDPFKGKQDLRNGIIRILHDKSFIDDPTRIYRAVRFEQRYNFSIDSRTEALIKRAVELGMLDKLSNTRTEKETELIRRERNPDKIFKRIEGIKGKH